MAVRRIKSIEQHVEKIVLAVAGAAFLGVLAWQFVGPRTTVNVPVGARAKDPVPVGDAYEIVAAEARKLQGEMQQKDFADLPKPPATGLLGEFVARHAGPVMPVKQVAAFGDVSPIVRDTRRIDDGGARPSGGDVAYNVPRLPPLEGVTANGFVAAIAHEEVESIPELAALAGKSEPHQLAAVTVEATLSGPALRAALDADPDGNGPIRALPRVWWDEGRLAALNIELQREELLPDGTWGDRRVVPAIPGRFSVAAKIKATASQEQMSALLAEVFPKEDQVLRPEWYARPAINGVPLGEEWLPPSEALKPEGDTSRRTKTTVARELKTEQSKRDRLDRELRQLSPGGFRPPRPGAGRPGTGPANPQSDPDQRRREQLERQIKQSDDLIKKLSEELKSLGVDNSATKVREQPAAILDDPIVQVWAHDVSVTRGKTYRYMIRLWVNNPMFAKANVTGAQAELKAVPAIATADSAWSAPVEAPPETYFFVTNASNVRAGGGGAFATVEMFRFEWGYWRRGSARFDPGDPLVVSADIPDVEKLRQLTPKTPSGQPGRPVPGPSTPGLPSPGGGKSPGAPGGFAPQPSPGQDPAKDKDDLKGPLVTRITISRDAFFLDTVASPLAPAGDRVAKPRDVFFAYLRDEGGTLVLREPQADQTSPDYKRLLRSARAGEESNKSLPEEITGRAPEAKKPKPEGEPEYPLPPPPPGGGGGGGGG